MIKRVALELLSLGISFVPIGRNKRPYWRLLPTELDPFSFNECRPKPTWAPYQLRLPTRDEVEQWFGPAKSLAVVGGAVSKGLLIMDFDAPGFYEDWCDQIGELAGQFPTQQTGGGGQQIFAHVEFGAGLNLKLAYTPDESHESGRSIAIETRGEGGYAIVPPSIHPNGSDYFWLFGGFDSIPVINRKCADFLLESARKLCQAPYTRTQLENGGRGTQDPLHRHHRTVDDRHRRTVDARDQSRASSHNRHRTANTGARFGLDEEVWLSLGQALQNPLSDGIEVLLSRSRRRGGKKRR